jgi:hypothetical protein
LGAEEIDQMMEEAAGADDEAGAMDSGPDDL